MLSDYRFWVLIVSFCLIGGNIAGMITHFIPMISDAGALPGEAASIASIIGISVILGRVGTGYLIDRIWAPGVAAVVLSLPVISCLILITGPSSYAAGLAAALFIGLAAGAEFDLMSFLVSRYFDHRRYGTIYSWLYAFFKLSAGIGAPLFGYVFDVTGAYMAILYAAMICLIAPSLLLLTLGRYRIDFEHL